MENKDAKYWLAEGDKLCGSGEYEEAVKCFVKVANLYDNSEATIQRLYYAYIQWGKKLRNQAKNEQDKSLLEKEFNINEEADAIGAKYLCYAKEDDAFYIWGNGLYDLAKIKQYENLLNEAEDLFREAICKYDEATQRRQDHPWPFISWGETLCCLAKIKQDKNLLNEAEDLFREAICKYDEAIELDSEDTYVFIRKGVALVDLAKIKRDEHDLYEKASKCFGEAKSILDIFVYLDKENTEQIVKTKVLYPLLNSDLDTDDSNFFNKSTKSSSQEELDKYKEIYILSIFIISQLLINKEYEIYAAHYTGKTSAQKMLFNKSKFMLNAINHSNDPTEGEILLKYLFIKYNPSEKETSDAEHRAFAGCFTFNYDSLNQFRLYGKDENQEECTGLSLIFRKDFFSKKSKMPTDKSDTKTKKTSTSNSLGLILEDEGYTLFRCIYIDPITQRVDTVGQKEEYLFYRKEDRETAKEKYKEYKEYIDNVIEIVDKKMKELRDLINQGSNQNTIRQLLINLRYLTKHIAFKEEQECRIVKILHIQNEDIKTNDDYKQIYIEYSPEVSKHAAKICFGPKAKNFELFKSISKIKGLKTKCEKSKNSFI